MCFIIFYNKLNSEVLYVSHIFAGVSFLKVLPLSIGNAKSLLRQIRID